MRGLSSSWSAIRGSFAAFYGTCLLFVLAFSITASAVPVMENELKVSGTVAEVCVVSATTLHIQPEQPIFLLRIVVESVEVIKPPNFLQGKVGETVTLLSKENIPQELFKKRVNLLLQYRGDEKGGGFWIRQILGTE